jgi:tetratricopeptide (TPR) repeat protein
MGGHFDEALRYMEEGFSISQQIGNEWGKTNSRSFAGIVYLRRGQIDRAESFLESTRQDAIGAGHPSGIYLHIQLAWLYSSIGREDPARQHANEALVWSRNFPPFLPASLSLMAHMAIRDGNLDLAAEFLAEAVSSGRINTLSIIEAQFELVSLELALARQEKEVTSLASALIERLENAGVVLFVPDACYLKARALLAEGERDQALQVLAKAVTLSEKFEFRTWLWPLALLAAEHHTDPAEVNRFQNIAAQAIDFIAGQTSNETYQAAFAEKVRQFKETGIL